MSKSKKRKKSRSTLPPIVALRPRLDQLFSESSYVEQDASAREAQLNEVFKQIKPQDFWPVLLKAYQAATDQVPAVFRGDDSAMGTETRLSGPIA